MEQISDPIKARVRELLHVHGASFGSEKQAWECVEAICEYIYDQHSYEAVISALGSLRARDTDR